MSILLASSGYLSLRPSRSTKIIARPPSRSTRAQMNARPRRRHRRSAGGSTLRLFAAFGRLVGAYGTVFDRPAKALEQVGGARAELLRRPDKRRFQGRLRV